MNDSAKTIGQIIGQAQRTTSPTLRRQQSKECSLLSTRQIEECSLFKQKHPTVEKMFRAYGADKWDFVLENIASAVNASAPTLSQLDMIYETTGAGKALFINQLTAYYTMVERSGKPMNQQAADLAARQFMGRYGKQCTPVMLLAYFANYSEFKGTLRDFDTEDVIQQFGKKFMKWWGDKTEQYYKKEPEKIENDSPRGTEGLISLIAQWLADGETEADIRDPQRHGLAAQGVITDEMIQKAKEIAMENF